MPKAIQISLAAARVNAKMTQEEAAMKLKVMLYKTAERGERDGTEKRVY